MEVACKGYGGVRDVVSLHLKAYFVFYSPFVALRIVALKCCHGGVAKRVDS